MRQYTALLLIALIGVSIQMQMTSEASPAQAVLNKIDELVQASRNEQAESTRIYLSQSKRCVDEKAFRNKEIQDASVAQGAADQQLAICKAEVPVASNSLKRSQSELAASKNQLNELVIEHSLYQAANLERQQEHVDAINNIQTAYNILGQFQNGRAAVNSNVFVQVSQHLNKIVRIAIKHQFHGQLLPVMTALVSLTAAPQAALSFSTLQKVVNLLRLLEKSVRASEQNRAKEWSKYEASYKKQNSLLNQQVVSLNRIINRYKNYLANLRSCVAKETKILQLATSKLNRNTNILQATVVMCNAYDVKYKVQTQERTAYIALLGQLRSFVVTAINEFKSGLYNPEQGEYVHE